MESVFASNVELIRTTLRSSYCLTEEETRGAEEDLHTWFLRLARRGPSPPPPKVLQTALLSAACEYGRSYQVWKLGGERSSDQRLNEVLARKPEDVARDAQNRFDTERS